MKKPPTPEEYARAKAQAAIAFAPDIYPCRDCKWPVVSGYCCTNSDCGSYNP